MPDDMELLIEQIAHHMAHRQERRVADVRPFVRSLVEDARQEYRESGSPYGETAAGFVRWIMDRQPLTPSA